MPLFTLVLINAQVPNVHTILEFLLDYGDYDEQGDISYTIANLEGSIMFIMDVEVPNDVLEHVQNSEMYQSIIASMQANRRRNSSTAGNPVNPNLANLPNSPKYYPFADSQIALEKIQKGVIKPNIVGRDIKDRSEKEVSLINSDIQSEIAIPVRLDSTRSASGSKGTSQSPKRSLDITTSQDEREAFIRLGKFHFVLVQNNTCIYIRKQISNTNAFSR